LEKNEVEPAQLDFSRKIGLSRLNPIFLGEKRVEQAQLKVRDFMHH